MVRKDLHNSLKHHKLIHDQSNQNVITIQAAMKILIRLIEQVER